MHFAASRSQLPALNTGACSRYITTVSFSITTTSTAHLASLLPSCIYAICCSCCSSGSGSCVCALSVSDLVDFSWYP